MYKQTWNDRSNEVRWCMIYASYFQTLSVCFLRRHSILLPQYSCQVVIFWKSFSLFSWTRCTFRLLFLIHGFFFIQYILFDAQSVPKFTTGWLLYAVDMSLSVFKDLLILGRHKNMSQAHFVLFLPQTWNQLFFLRSLSSFEWGMVFGNQDLSTRYAHL